MSETFKSGLLMPVSSFKNAARGAAHNRENSGRCLRIMVGPSPPTTTFVCLPKTKSLIPAQSLQKNQSSKLTSTEGKHTALRVYCCQPTGRVKGTGKQMVHPTPLLNTDPKKKFTCRWERPPVLAPKSQFSASGRAHDVKKLKTVLKLYL